MSKVEELASKEWKDLGFVNNEQSNAFKLGYLKGYHQAEKDLELTWEDIVLIRLAFDATEANINLGAINIQPMTKEYYQEVLKCFNKERKKK